MYRLNRLGLSLCTAYLVLTLILAWAAHSAEGDPKGQFVLLQLPIALQLATADFLGLATYIREWSFPIAYSFFVPAACIVLYASAVAVSRIWCRSKSIAIAIVLAPWIIFMFRTPLRQLYHGIFL